MCNEKTFDELAELFKRDPAEFNEYKTDFIEQHIASVCADCPEKLKRCRQYQWRIDRELAKHKNPIMRYNAMVEMFWKGVEEFKYVSTMTPSRKQTKPATIIQFGKKE